MDNSTPDAEAQGHPKGESGMVGFIERLLDEKDGTATFKERRDASPARVDAVDHELLQWLADYFGVKKTAFANDLLARAMEDAVGRIALREGREVREKMEEVYLRARGPHRDEPGWITEDGGETWTRAKPG